MATYCGFQDNFPSCRVTLSVDFDGPASVSRFLARGFFPVGVPSY